MRGFDIYDEPCRAYLEYSLRRGDVDTADKGRDLAREARVRAAGKATVNGAS